MDNCIGIDALIEVSMEIVATLTVFILLCKMYVHLQGDKHVVICSWLTSQAHSRFALLVLMPLYNVINSTSTYRSNTFTYLGCLWAYLRLQSNLKKNGQGCIWVIWYVYAHIFLYCKTVYIMDHDRSLGRAESEGYQFQAIIASNFASACVSNLWYPEALMWL